MNVRCFQGWRKMAGAVALALAAISASGGETWRRIPVPMPVADGAENVASGGWFMAECETTVADFAAYVNAAGRTDFPETAQLVRDRAGRAVPRRGMGRQAVAEVTAADAEGYAAWRAAVTGQRIRLPREAEWELAARGGIDGAPWPWGWGGEPERLAQFAAEGPSARTGMFPANGFGLRDMAGNLFEWCAPDSANSSALHTARGGAWTERNPECLRVDRRQDFAEGYRGRDTGFRLLREEESHEMER